jgi:alanine racemase
MSRMRRHRTPAGYLHHLCEGKPGLRSIAASGGILLWPQSHFDWARPGIILYGVSPLDDRSTGAILAASR